MITCDFDRCEGKDNVWLYVQYLNMLQEKQMKLIFALFCFSSHQSLIFDEVDLSDASVAETSTKNINNSFTVSNKTGLKNVE